MMSIQSAYRDDLHTCTNDGVLVELLLKPELLESNLSSALYLTFVFTAFLFLYLNSTLCASMFKLNLHTCAPTFAEVVSEIDDYMR